METGEIAVFVGKDFVITVRHGEGQELASAAAPSSRTGPTVLAQGPACGPARRRRRGRGHLHRGGRRAAAGRRRGRDERLRRRHRSTTPHASTTSSARSSSSSAPSCPLGRASTASRTTRRCRTAGGGPAVLPRRRDHVARVQEQVESMDTLLSSSCRRTSRRSACGRTSDMRKITAWAAIITVPTLIAGIYGMNFKHMPELRVAVRLRHGPAVHARASAPCSTGPSASPAGSSLGQTSGRRGPRAGREHDEDDHARGRPGRSRTA